MDISKTEESTHDILRLTVANEASVINAVISRYETGDIYTWLGDSILVSLNPGCPVPHLYTVSERSRISQHDSLRNKPHIYSVAEKCLRQLQTTSLDQSIVISGISGSGKTEAAKHILQYLVFTNRKAHENKGSTFHESHIEEVLIRSNTILEAFGNAKTIFNENSSRFGKYTSIQYDKCSESLLSASISIYLLEKPRAVFSQHSLLYSFHVFRLLLTSLSNDQWERYGLRFVLTPLELAKEPVSVDQQLLTWPNLLNALTSLGFTSDNVDQLICLLLAIYSLNTVEFLPASPQSKPRCTSSVEDSSATAMISPSDVYKVHLAGRLLGLTGQPLEQFPAQLITRHLQAGRGVASAQRRMTVYSATCSLSQAEEQRDCLVKALYKGLFDTLVAIINDNLSTHSKEKNQSQLSVEIGILDLFGFENFAHNSFEQFSINYANERLHEEFMRVAVNSAYDQLVSEGLKPAHISVQSDGQSSVEETLMASCDNSHLIAAMEACAGLLDEVCLLNRVHRKADRYQAAQASLKLDNRETDWLHRIRAHFSSSSNYNAKPATLSRSKLMSPVPTKTNKRNSRGPAIRVSNAADSFTVEHYTGFVDYSPEKFVSKNLDHLPTHLLTWLADSLCLGSPTLDDLENRMPPFAPSTTQETVGVFSIRELLRSITKNIWEPESLQPTPTRHVDQSEEKRFDSTPLKAINTARNTGLRLRGCSPLARDQVKKKTIDSPAGACTSPVHRPVSRRRHTVFSDFRSSVNSLLQKLGRHRVSFVRCLRVECCQSPPPSTATSARLGDSCHPDVPRDMSGKSAGCWEFVRSQVISGGLLAAATILNSAYPVRYTYGEFMTRYRTLWRLCHVQGSASMSPPADKGSSHRHLSNTDFDALLNRYLDGIQLPRIPKNVSSLQLRRETGDSVIQQQQRIVLLLLTVGLEHQRLLGDQQTASPGADSNTVATADPSISQLIGQFGRSRLFLTGSQVDRLDRLRGVVRSAAARLLQRSFLRCLARLKAARCIQRHWRGSRARRPNSHCRTEPEQSPTPPPLVSSSTVTTPPVPTPSSPPSTFPTHKPHIVSRHCIYHLFSLKAGDRELGLWNPVRIRQLHCLVPYAHRGLSKPLTSHEETGQGLLVVLFSPTDDTL